MTVALTVLGEIVIRSDMFYNIRSDISDLFSFVEISFVPELVLDQLNTDVDYSLLSRNTFIWNLYAGRITGIGTPQAN